MDFLPGTASLVEEVDSESPRHLFYLTVSERLMVTLRDGLKLFGTLRSFDQFALANIVLEDTVERIYLEDQKQYGERRVGIRLIRGENVVLLGEIDEEKDDKLLESRLTKIPFLDAKKAQKAEEHTKREAAKLKKKIMLDRGIVIDSYTFGSDLPLVSAVVLKPRRSSSTLMSWIQCTVMGQTPTPRVNLEPASVSKLILFGGLVDNKVQKRRDAVVEVSAGLSRSTSDVRGSFLGLINSTSPPVPRVRNSSHVPRLIDQHEKNLREAMKRGSLDSRLAKTTKEEYEDVEYRNDLWVFDNRQHCLVTVAEHRMIILFGGYDGVQYYDDMYRLDTTDLRGGHTMSIIHDTTGLKLALFGGKNHDEHLNDIWLLDLKTLRWQKISVSGDSPTVRAFHSMSVIDRWEACHPTNQTKESSGDFHQFSLDSGRWTKMVGNNTTPSPSATLGNRVLIFGGAAWPSIDASSESKSNNTIAVEPNLYIYDVHQQKWKCVVLRSLIRGQETPRCFQHSATLLYDSKLFIFEQAVMKEEASVATPTSPPFQFFVRKNSKKNIVKSPKSNQRNSTLNTVEVGLPYNFKRKLHVNFDYQWTGQDPTEVFEIQDLLGIGAYGTVCKAKHKETGYNIAIKELMIKNQSEELKREIDILKKCKHANVVSYFGSCQFGEDKLWILMDYCQLGSVRDLFEAADETLNEEEIAYICSQTLRGLVYLHSNNIIHRDVKSANILLTDEAQIKIADFGVSDVIGKANDSIGTPLWMAPEVVKGTHYDSKCDVWSLGITMADGIPPYADKKIRQAMMMVPLKPPPTVRDPSSFSTEFNKFVASLLIKEPEKRPTSANLLHQPLIQSAKGPEVLRERIHNVLELLRERRSNLRKASMSMSDGESSGSSTSSTSLHLSKSLISLVAESSSNSLRRPSIASTGSAEKEESLEDWQSTSLVHSEEPNETSVITPRMTPAPVNTPRRPSRGDSGAYILLVCQFTHLDLRRAAGWVLEASKTKGGLHNSLASSLSNTPVSSPGLRRNDSKTTSFASRTNSLGTISAVAPPSPHTPGSPAALDAPLEKVSLIPGFELLQEKLAKLSIPRNDNPLYQNREITNLRGELLEKLKPQEAAKKQPADAELVQYITDRLSGTSVDTLRAIVALMDKDIV
ncbi:hypothetical protein PROFUN_11897 [Planoprotostelium fungivorum]|uniref:non-specific serine/threonine protein kinase n=1 Tax=Planoprotostelium fungivorum TaxID=1890364 RepID=A0A2P6N923_9EUKA|nr:hypothetical protein PROFUN_11897 [Planoprotostelium fungivorum]